jgi:hypothetical protein
MCNMNKESLNASNNVINNELSMEISWKQGTLRKKSDVMRVGNHLFEVLINK